MIVIIGHLQTSPEKAKQLKKAAAPLVAASREEPGNIAYAFAEDISTPGLVHFIERWRDERRSRLIMEPRIWLGS